MVSNSVNKLGITELYNIQDKHIKSHSKLNVSERIHYLVKLKKQFSLAKMKYMML